MFHTTANTTRSILNNNENVVMRSKSINSAKSTNGVTTMKKTSFDENSVKTPHNKKDSKGLGGGSQTTQRRRRALGDISNRKGSGAATNGGGGKNGGVVLKQTTTTLKSKFPSSTTKKNRTTQVKFSKTPSTKSNNGNGGLLTTNKACLGGAIIGESSIKSSSTNSKPKQRSSSSNNTIAPTSTLSSTTTTDEYDGIFEATTRWAQHEDESNRSVYDTVPKEELEMFDNYRDDLFDRHVKEDAERIRLEKERDEGRFTECMRAVHDNDEDDLGTGGLGFGELDTINDDLLADKLPWEIEDGEFDPAEERRLSGSDPLSLWGDVY